MAIDEALLARLTQPGGYVDESLGVPPPANVPDVPAQSFTPGFHDRLLEAIYGGTQGVDFAQPHGFGESFLQGLTGSLQGQGAQVAARRAKFEANQTARRAATDAERLKATADYNKRKADALGEVAKEGRAQGYKATDEARKAAGDLIPIDATMAARYPALKAFIGQSWSPDRLKYYTEQSPKERAAEALTRAQAGSGTDAKDIADAIEQGLQPPDTKGLYRMGAPVRAELARRKYDLTTANKDWQAVSRSISTLNGPQQTRLRQAVETAYNSLDVIDQLNDQLAKEIPRGSIRSLNHAAMLAAMNGAFGPAAAATATKLNGQITDVVSELGNAYMGGNSPTDHALGLAQKNLSGDWSQDVLRSMTGLARTNLGIRRNSILNAQPVTPGMGSADNRVPQVAATPADSAYVKSLGLH